MLRHPGDEAGAKGSKGQTPFSRSDALKGLTPRRSDASKGLTPRRSEALKGLTPHRSEGLKGLTHQRGWVGMIVLLLALAIVAWLSKDALKQYAFMAPATTNVKMEAASPGERARAPAAIEASGATVDSAAPTPTAPMDRVRGLETRSSGRKWRARRRQLARRAPRAWARGIFIRGGRA